MNEPEARSLDYFRRVVAPAISGKLDSEFWNKLVLQAGSDTPAIRNATIAISSLYESFGSSSTQPNQLAVKHYNRAIRDVMSTSDQHEVLLVCVLFVCIEFLMGNSGAATDHCSHGITILNSMLTNNMSLKEENLLDIFCRLSLFPFFFGSTPQTFPLLSGWDGQTSSTPYTIPDLGQLQRQLDLLVCRIIRLVRNGDDFRLGARLGGDIPIQLLAEQNELEQQLQLWETRFRQLEQPEPTTQDDRSNYAGLEIKFLVARVWSRNAFAPDETAYDAYINDFKRTIHVASDVAHFTSTHDSLTRPKFRFEMGLFPLLYFVAIKCRVFDIRIEALRLMNILAVRRENLWDLVVMNAVARRIIEMEHGISLDDAMVPAAKVPPSETVPHSVARIMDSVMDPHGTILEAGSSRRVTFFITSDDGAVNLAREWVSV